MSGDSVAVLGISASENLSCALRFEDRLHERAAERGTRSAGKLAAFVAEALSEAECKAQDIAEIRIDIGPGSYTGLRAAIAFAQMAAGFAQAKIFTTSSSELQVVAGLATGKLPAGALVSALRKGTGGRLLCTDLQVGDKVRVHSETRAWELGELLQQLPPERLLLVSAGLETADLSNPQDNSPRPLEAVEYTARHLFDPALVLVPVAAEGLEPLYLMGSYAE